MREIKFRAWDKVFKQMVLVREIHFANEEIIYWPAGRVNQLATFSNVELMQYTGLKDKNDKEICEGDIVRTNHGDAVVYFDRGGFRVRLRTDGYFLFHLSVDIEIIGNIHENPELLEQKVTNK